MRVDLAVFAAAIQLVLMLMFGLSAWVSINRQLARLTGQVEMLISGRVGVESWSGGPRRRFTDPPESG